MNAMIAEWFRTISVVKMVMVKNNVCIEIIAPLIKKKTVLKVSGVIGLHLFFFMFWTYQIPGIDSMLSLFSFKGSSECQNKESYCEAARPDCSTSQAKQDCKKYCGLCKSSSCVNKEPWCEAAKPDCKTSFAKKNCKKFCGLCEGKKLIKFTKWKTCYSL